MNRRYIELEHAQLHVKQHIALLYKCTLLWPHLLNAPTVKRWHRCACSQQLDYASYAAAHSVTSSLMGLSYFATTSTEVEDDRSYSLVLQNGGVAKRIHALRNDIDHFL